MRIRIPGPTAASKLALAAALALASTASAQDEPPGPDGEGADSEVTRYRDWAVECRQPQSAGPEVCLMFQRQVLDNGRTLLLMTVRKTADNPDPMAMLQLPLGVLLQPGVSISVDDGEPRELSYTLCNNDGCLAVFPLDDGMKEALVKGITARVVLITADRRELPVEVSLSGFSAALNAL